MSNGTFVSRFKARLNGCEVEVSWDGRKQNHARGRPIYLVAVKQGDNEPRLVSLEKLTNIPPGRAAVTRQILDRNYGNCKKN